MIIRRVSIATITLLVFTAFIVSMGFVTKIYLVPWLNEIFPQNILSIISSKMEAFNVTSPYHIAILICGAVCCSFTGILDSILCQRRYFQILRSFNILLLLLLGVIVLFFCPINSYWFIGVLYVFSYIGIFLSYRKILHNNRISTNPILLVKGLFKPCHDGVNNLIDEWVIKIWSTLLLISFILVNISFLVFIFTILKNLF